MEIAIVVLSSLLLICCIVSGSMLISLRNSLKNERNRFDNLTDNIFDYKMVWTEDLSYIEFGKKLVNLLASCGLAPDKNYIKSVFGDSSLSNDGEMSLCVNALRKSGTVSEYYSSDGVSGLIHWKSVSFTQKDGSLRICSLGRDISGETISRKVNEELRAELLGEFDNLRRAEENAQASIFSFISEGENLFVKTSPRLCGLWGFENTDTIPLD
ncbi:MAG: hypothetical protein K2K41_08360, partial [Ruminiclostridium sp.]|nr:hypothetical protein [Ruminiclostridium sp.]